MQNGSFSINDTAINNIIMDIDSYEKNIRQILNNIVETYANLSKCTNYSGKQSYLLKSKLTTANVKVATINLENYKADLRKIKVLYRNAALRAADELKKAARQKDVGREYRN